MRDLAGRVAEPDPLVKRGRADIDGPPVGIRRVAEPESNVLPFARIVADGLLERQVLLAAEQIEIAHRCIVVGTFEHRRIGNVQTTAPRQRIGRKPFGGQHDRLHFVLAADKRHIQRIAVDAGTRVRDARNVLQRGMPPRV